MIGENNVYLSAFLLTYLLVLSTLLLVSKIIDGPSYVAMLTLGSFGVMVYRFFPEITDLTIAGNPIKIKQKINETETITRELSELHDITIKYTLNSIRNSRGHHSKIYIIKLKTPHQLTI